MEKNEAFAYFSLKVIKKYLLKRIDTISGGDYIYAFWDGRSRGTKYSIDKAREMGKVVKVFEFGWDKVF